MDTPPELNPTAAESQFARLLSIMQALRDPASGCPWDLRQDFTTIAPYTLEEAYEVADAIGRGDMPALQDELGDLLFQVVYHARLAEEAGAFAFPDVARSIADKMVRRHPAIFPGETAGPNDWEEQKSAERLARQQHGTLDGIPLALPALTRALRLTTRAGRVGFDWPDVAHVLNKLEEEVSELRAELPDASPARLADELGDVLFVVANLARKLKLDPETCLRQANAKFARRFEAVEKRLAAKGQTPRDAGLEAMESEWVAVKAGEREDR